MKTLVALAALLIAQPAFAEKNWVDEGCGITLSSENDTFTIRPVPGNEAAVIERSCKVSYWPISTPVAEMKCSDGKAASMELFEDGRIKFDNVMMLPVGDGDIGPCE